MYRLVGSAAAVRPISRLVGSSVAGVATTPVRCFSDLDAPKSVFDRAVKVAHRERAATARRVAGSEPLAAEVTMRLLDRLEDIKGREFPVAVTFGGAGRQVLEQLADGRAGVKHLHMFDSSAATIREAQECAADLATRGVQVPELTCALADEEHLPLQNASVDGAPALPPFPQCFPEDTGQSIACSAPPSNLHTASISYPGFGFAVHGCLGTPHRV